MKVFIVQYNFHKLIVLPGAGPRLLRVQLSGRPLPSHFRTQGRGGEEYLPEGHHEWVEK